jgi:hypothetical protein
MINERIYMDFDKQINNFDFYNEFVKYFKN